MSGFDAVSNGLHPQATHMGDWYTRLVFRRYALACALILAVSAGVAGLASAAGKKSVASATCAFQAYAQTSRTPPSTADNVKILNTFAAQRVTTVVAAGLYRRVERQEKVPAGTIGANTNAGPGPGIGTFFVTVHGTDPKLVTRLANAVCDGFVEAVSAQRKAEIDAQVKEMTARIGALQAEVRRLQAIPKNKRTATTLIELKARQGALIGAAAVITNILSLPPDNISVLSRAANASVKETSDRTKFFLVAILGGLLACFLYILIGEWVVEQRRRTGPAPR